MLVRGGGAYSASLPSKFVDFSNFLGLLVVGFENEITFLLRKIKLRKGCEIKVSRGSRKFLSTRLEREIRKLECPMNYNCSPLSIRGKGG